jgi:hypothetical protein
VAVLWVQARGSGILALAVTSLACSLLLIPTKAGASASARHPSEARKGGGLRVGLITNAQAADKNVSVTLDEVQPTGTRWLREDFDWNVIEPQDDEWHWGRYDNLLIEAANRGMHILPVLIYTPPWAGSAWNALPADRSEYAEYTAKVVNRYGPHGRLWRRQKRRCRKDQPGCRLHPGAASFAPSHFEFWNEPYLKVFSADGVDPARYARLVKAAAKAGRRANRRAKYLLAADQGPSGDRLTFIDGMYAAVPHLNSYFDAVAAHPYTTGHSPDDVHGGWGFPRIANIRAKFVSHGARGKPLWVTEIGWSTCPSHSYCVSEQTQADYLARMFELLRTTYSGYVRAVFVYARRDLPPATPSEPIFWYGLERGDDSHKPAFDVFRQAATAP